LITIPGWMALRNTPTCVGKTMGTRVHENQEEKHPHVCGEDRTCHVSPISNRETPPRVWGRLTAVLTPLLAYRNTPTCVGKTW